LKKNWHGIITNVYAPVIGAPILEGSGMEATLAKTNGTCIIARSQVSTMMIAFCSMSDSPSLSFSIVEHLEQKVRNWFSWDSLQSMTKERLSILLIINQNKYKITTCIGTLGISKDHITLALDVLRTEPAKV